MFWLVAIYGECQMVPCHSIDYTATTVSEIYSLLVRTSLPPHLCLTSNTDCSSQMSHHHFCSTFNKCNFFTSASWCPRLLLFSIYNCAESTCILLIEVPIPEHWWLGANFLGSLISQSVAFLTGNSKVPGWIPIGIVNLGYK